MRQQVLVAHCGGGLRLWQHCMRGSGLLGGSLAAFSSRPAFSIRRRAPYAMIRAPLSPITAARKQETRSICKRAYWEGRSARLLCQPALPCSSGRQ
jgi:hypothetical protein